jgi:2-octaprenyl-6-methoxyphenol hydroxylase
VTDGLVHLFANRWAPLVVGRNVGLMAMELFTPRACAGGARWRSLVCALGCALMALC